MIKLYWREFMFFKKKYIIDCTITCVAKNMIYSIDNDGRNKSICEYQFSFVEPENSKILYAYNETSNLYQLDKWYKAKFNEKDGSFEILKEC